MPPLTMPAIAAASCTAVTDRPCPKAIWSRVLSASDVDGTEPVRRPEPERSQVFDQLRLVHLPGQQHGPDVRGVRHNATRRELDRVVGERILDRLAAGHHLA